MNKILIIVQREYITRVRKRSFLITTLLTPLGFFLLIAGSAFIGSYSQGKMDVAIVDDSGLFKDVNFPDAEDQTVYFHKVNENFDELSGKMADKVHSAYQAIIHIPANFNINNPSSPVISGLYTVRPGMVKRQYINERMNDAVDKLRMKMLHIDDEAQENLQKKVEINFISLKNNQENKQYAEAASIVGIIMGIAIYISLLLYGTMIMRAVMEEKTSRIVELLASSVKPFQLLMGKIIGVGAVGITQCVLWVVLMAAIFIFGLPLLGLSTGPQAPQMAQMRGAEVDPDSLLAMMNSFHQLPLLEIAILFPIYFLGGFLLYGSLFAAVGSAVGEDGDQQSLTFPLTIPIVISFGIAMSVVNNPDSPLGFWSSLIPFSSPVVMCAMLPLKPAWWQIALSIALLIGGFIFTTYIAARIYRVGILMYGKKIRLKEMARWVFAKA